MLKNFVFYPPPACPLSVTRCPPPLFFKGSLCLKSVVECSSGSDRSANLRNETTALEEIIFKFLFKSLVGGECV